jgi:hypothetical protein
MIAAGAAVLAVVAAGVVYETTRDSGPTATDTPASTTSVQNSGLGGSGHQHGGWVHAGTTTGGHTMLGP